MKNNDSKNIMDKIQDYKLFIRSFGSFKFMSLKETLRDVLRLVVIVVFFPVLLLLLIFENRLFTRILKQMITFLYFIFLLVFFYSIFTYKTYILSHRTVTVDVPFSDKIADM